MKPLILYYAPTPNGWKLSILLEECKLPYDVVPINLLAGDQFEPNFLKISPNNRMPALVDYNVPQPKALDADHIQALDETESEFISVFESGAIMSYLAEAYPLHIEPFFPSEKKQRKAVFEWLFWVNAGLGPMAGQLSHFTYYAPKYAPEKDHSYALARYRKEYDRLISVMELQLARTGGFLAGPSYTVADMAAWPWIKPWKRWMGNDFDDYPLVRKWYNCIKARPAVKRGMNVLKSAASKAQAQREGRHSDKLTKKELAALFGQDGKIRSKI